MNEEIDRIRKTFNFTNDKFIDEIHGSIRLDMSFVKDFKKLLNYIDKLQKELDKKDEAIDVMSEFLCGIDVVDELGQDSWNWNKKQMKEYFYKKVEEKYE